MGGKLPFDQAVVPGVIRDRWQGRSRPETSATQQWPIASYCLKRTQRSRIKSGTT